MRAPGGQDFARVARSVRTQQLHTVCQEAHCPNLGECWGRGTATFLILGDVCTRACSFCAVKKGLPAPPDPGEPRRVAEASLAMGLTHVVVTSVTRDDQPDGGAAAFAGCVREIRARAGGVTVELLVPDFKGDWSALDTVLHAAPDVLNHNVETVPRLYPAIRPAARFERSVELLRRSAARGLLTKSGIMVGLGEEAEEVRSTIRAIGEAGTQILTVGQYLRPSPANAAVERYYPPEEFSAIKAFALGLGFRIVESAPLVRSSYHAEGHVAR